MPDSLHIVCPHCDAVNRVPASKLKDQPTCGKCAQALFTGHPVELNATNFMKHITRSDIAVLVDFWAPWCGPCRTMAPAYEQAARQLEPGIRVVKLNTEDAQAIAGQYVIRSIPTLALFQNGKEVARQAGATDTPRIVAWVQAHAKPLAKA
jgi:thioredoxin 2